MKPINKILILTIPSLLAWVVFFAGCKKDSNNEGMTQMKVRMVDAPSPYAFEEVNIDVIGAEANIDGQWYVLTVAPGVYNILTLVNGTNVLLVNDSVPAGRMSQFRLILGNANTIKVDGQIHPLTIPSGSESGLKINVQEDLPVGEYTFMIDFDAAHSIVLQGNGEYKLKPVLHGFTVESSGKIDGTILPAGIGIAIIAENNANAQITYATYADVVTGHFLLQGMVAGTYTVKIFVAGSDIPVIISNVVVTNGTTTSVGITTLP
jgi:hypothetical protein